jgi:hypothetical protein
MASLLEKISELNDLVLQGRAMEAFEKYYHSDVVMQENENPPTVGKSVNRRREEAFFGSILQFNGARPLKVAVGEGISMVEWHYDYNHKELGSRNYKQVSVQEWKDGLIIKETFYYNV